MKLLVALLILGAAAAVPLRAQEVKGARGIEAARRGGVIIACRHAMTDRFNEDEATLRYDDPSTQRRLSRRGEWQAEAMGKAFRALEIGVGEVIASPMQRARIYRHLGRRQRGAIERMYRRSFHNAHHESGYAGAQVVRSPSLM